MPHCRERVRAQGIFNSAYRREIAKMSACFRIVELEPKRFVVRICQGRSVY